MARYRTEFGSVVNVDDATAARQGDKWTSLDTKPEPKSKSPARSGSTKSDEK